MVPGYVEQMSFVVGFLVVSMPVFGFGFRLGCLAADYLVKEIKEIWRR